MQQNFISWTNRLSLVKFVYCLKLNFLLVLGNIKYECNKIKNSGSMIFMILIIFHLLDKDSILPCVIIIYLCIELQNSGILI